MDAKTFIINEPAATGLVTYSGVGFQGKLVLINAVNRSSGGNGASAGWMFGAATSSTNRWVVSGRSDNGQAAQSSGSKRASGNVIQIANTSGTNSASADFDSWTSDGFKLDWTAVDSTTRQYVVTVLGGSDFSATVGQSTTPASTGNQSISSLSFQPNTLLFFDCRLNNVSTGDSTYWRPSFGFIDSSGAAGGWGANSYDAADPTVTSRVQSTSGYVATASTDGGIDRRCQWVSYNSNGFTLNWTVLDASFGASTDYQWVAMSVPKSVKGNVAARTSTGTTQISGLGHSPQLILLGGVESTQTTGTGDPTSNFALGMVGGTGAGAQAVVAFEDKDNQATSNSSSKFVGGKAINFITANGSSPTDDIVANVSAIDYDTFTLNYTTVTATAVQVIYLSLGTQSVTYSSSFIARAITRKTTSQTFTANAVLKKNISGSFTANAVLKKTISSSFTANAAFVRSGTGSFTADADLQKAGLPVWTTPENLISMITQPVLTFTMPQATGNMFFQIELDTVDTFDSGNYVSYSTWSSVSGWQYWNGSTWQGVPAAGVSNSFSGNEARLTVPVALSPGTWYRRVRVGAY